MPPKLKGPLVRAAILASLVTLTVVAFTVSGPARAFYSLHIFPALQNARGTLLGLIPVSLGDILYLLAGIYCLVLLIRYVFFLFLLRQYNGWLLASLVRLLNGLMVIYLLFMWGWGINYYKQPLAESWGMQVPASRAEDSAGLVAFNQFLVAELNRWAPRYRPYTRQQADELAEEYYRQHTNAAVSAGGLHIKASVFGPVVERLAIEGYYNPFTGEGQINSALPAFLLPFVIGHEMAHQAGIAAEGDANLMAYALTTATDDPTFRYSGYLNIWLYAQNRLARRDTGLARQFSRSLNPLTRAHIDTLKQLARKYQNPAARYSSELYDNYLKMQQQQEGIKSYGNVTASAWQLELRRAQKKNSRIMVP